MTDASDVTARPLLNLQAPRIFPRDLAVDKNDPIAIFYKQNIVS